MIQPQQGALQQSNKINQAFKEREIQTRAKTAGMPYVSLIGVPLNSDLAATLPFAEAQKGKAALFFKSGKKLKLAVTDPADPDTRALIQSLTNQGFEASLNLCSPESLQAGYALYSRVSQPKQEAVQEGPRNIQTSSVNVTDWDELKRMIETLSFEAALQTITVTAEKFRSSDIHFQPEKDHVMVRFRTDGVLKHVFDLTAKVYQGILTEIKYAARMKANVTEIPQDGQYSFTMDGRPINVRTSLLPTQYGETCVMRLLDPEKTFVDFKMLGYSGASLGAIEEAVALPHGMVLVTGPTGSGKTTTMYSMLKKIDVGIKKVITLEDPIEYNLPGISQSQVDPERDFTFSAGLRAILRQDPDIIMVGEIRDLETAETAAQAALTGHLMISTLHTNSAVEAIPRLVNMGVRSFILAPALKLIVAQRLVRKMCPTCAVDVPLEGKALSEINEVIHQVEAKGVACRLPKTIKQAGQECAACGRTGYMGQLAIVETLRFDDTLRDFILENKSMPEIYQYIHEELKMLTMKEDGVLKVLQGLTTLEEVLRVAA